MEVLTLVGGAALGPLFQSLLDDLRSGDVLKYAREKGVRQELRKWEETLKTINAVLEMAEEQQRTNPSVKVWFNDLQDLAYDVEDILDEFNTKAKLQSKAGTYKLHKVICSCVARLTFVSTAEIKDISERLQSIKRQMEFLKLSTNESKIQVKEVGTTSLTSSEVNEADVYGRKDDRKKILDQLKNESGDGRMVIPIVGMGGLGKTTLAQLVYHDASLQFDFKAWVTVGESFDVLTITKAILRQFGDDQSKDFSSLQTKLKEKLSGKKTLVVLDDVWITDKEYQLWTLFFTPFKAGTSGSRILVTTRDRSAANITSNTDGYYLQKLSSDDCLSILAYHALEGKDFSEHPDLKELGAQIAKKCDGLPLAAKALGGVLRGKQDISSWEGVLNNKIWEERTNVHQALQLSYNHLSSHLKRCFGYTAIFPKDHQFDKTKLVPLWMAEGFVAQMKDGYKYFDELLTKSFFQKSSSDESLYVMHDLINDLARSVSGNFCFNLDEEKEKSCAKVRYSAFTCHTYDVAPRFERFHEMKRLRTFLGLRHCDRGYRDNDYLSPTVLDVVVEKLGLLRVLALPYAISELPASIDRLKHLRCLDLSYSPIVILPESLCKLFNLISLILFRCRELRELPKGFCNLINLQFLDIRYTNSLKEMPLGIGELKNLHILGEFVVGKSDGNRMLELLKIPNFQGRQHISALLNVRNVVDVECWKMRQLEGIDALTLEWKPEGIDALPLEWRYPVIASLFDDSLKKKSEEVLSALKPQKNIMKLSIEYYGGRELASWIGDPSFGKMKILYLHSCFNVASLPALGQLPSLEKLTLNRMNGIKQVGMAFYGNDPSSADVFPSLKILRIDTMEELYEWSNYSIDENRGQVFPKLEILELENCPKLEVCSFTFPKLEKFELKNCPKLEVCSFTFPNLDELIFGGCKEVVSFRNLQSLTKLKIERIAGLESFNRAFLEALVSLQEMEVRNCGELKHMWVDQFNVDRLGCLKKLEICNCNELVSLVEEDEGNFPLNLQQLVVWYCAKLEKLPNQLHSLTSLTDLAVRYCPKLETFPTRGLPYSVKRVSVQNCDSLVSLGEGIIVDNNDNSNSGLFSQIEVLTIINCKALNLPSNLGFPASLRVLCIDKSPVEAQLLRSLQLQNGFSHLTYLSLEKCSNLESFPDTSPPIPTLLNLTLWECEKLRSLPNHMNQFTSLQTLQMKYCPQVASFPEGGLPTSLQTLEMYDCPQVASFPEGGLPTNLKRLQLSYCDKLESKVMLEQILNALICLERLEIKVGGGMDDVNSLLLPTSLTSLDIKGFRNLKSISSGTQTLNSLEELIIEECPKLQSLPRVASLGRLEINKCPILEKKYRRRKGNFWHLLSSVPSFEITDYWGDKPARLRK